MITFSSTMLSFEGSLFLYERKALHSGKLERLHLNSAVWADWCSCCLKRSWLQTCAPWGHFIVQVLWNVLCACSPSLDVPASPCAVALQAGRGFEHLHLELRLLQSFSYKDVSKLEFWKPLFLQWRCTEQKRVESQIYIPHHLLST